MNTEKRLDEKILAALQAAAPAGSDEVLTYEAKPCGCAIGLIYDAQDNELYPWISCAEHEKAWGFQCEDCEEFRIDVEYCQPPGDSCDGANLCTPCHERRLHPEEFRDWDSEPGGAGDPEGRRF